MWLRRVFYWWLLPAAFVLPLWLFIGWAVAGGGAWRFLWVLFIALPSVLLGQLALALLVRARGTVRAKRPVSWGDVLGFTVWHGLTVALGFFASPAWVPLMIATIIAGLGLFWFVLWELISQSRPVRLLRAAETSGSESPAAPGPAPRVRSDDPDVFVISETPPSRS